MVKRGHYQAIKVDPWENDLGTDVKHTTQGLECLYTNCYLSLVENYLLETPVHQHFTSATDESKGGLGGQRKPSVKEVKYRQWKSDGHVLRQLVLAWAQRQGMSGIWDNMAISSITLSFPIPLTQGD